MARVWETCQKAQRCPLTLLFLSLPSPLLILPACVIWLLPASVYLKVKDYFPVASPSLGGCTEESFTLWRSRMAELRRETVLTQGVFFFPPPQNKVGPSAVFKEKKKKKKNNSNSILARLVLLHRPARVTALLCHLQCSEFLSLPCCIQSSPGLCHPVLQMKAYSWRDVAELNVTGPAALRPWSVDCHWSATFFCWSSKPKPVQKQSSEGVGWKRCDVQAVWWSIGWAPRRASLGKSQRASRGLGNALVLSLPFQVKITGG